VTMNKSARAPAMTGSLEPDKVQRSPERDASTALGCRSWVTIRPIQLIDGSHEVNEVFFYNVRVPADQIVGYVPFLDRASLERGEVRAGVRLREPLRPPDVEVCSTGKEAFLEFGGAERQSTARSSLR